MPNAHTSNLTHTCRHPVTTCAPNPKQFVTVKCLHPHQATAPHRMRARAGGRTYLNLCGGAPGVGGTSYSEVTASSLGPTWGGGLPHTTRSTRRINNCVPEVCDAHGGQRLGCSCGKALRDALVAGLVWCSCCMEGLQSRPGVSAHPLPAPKSLLNTAYMLFRSRLLQHVSDITFASAEYACVEPMLPSPHTPAPSAPRACCAAPPPPPPPAPPPAPPRPAAPAAPPAAPAGTCRVPTRPGGGGSWGPTPGGRPPAARTPRGWTACVQRRGVRSEHGTFFKAFRCFQGLQMFLN